MLTQEPKETEARKTIWKKSFAGVNIAFVLSIFGHLALLLLVGGAVLQYGRTDPKMFTAQSLDAPPLEEEPPEVPVPDATPEDAPQDMERASSSPEAAAPELITMDVTSPTTNVAFSANVPTLSAETGFGKGQNGKENGAGGGKGALLKKMNSVFGSTEESADGLSGFFYDIKQTSDRKSVYPDIFGVLDSLVDKDEKILKDHYRAPKPLTAFQFFIPAMPAEEAPKAYGVEKEVKPGYWLAVYKGNITSKVTGTFRFVGMGDDILVVRFNRKFVLDGSWTVKYGTMNNEDGIFNGPYCETMNVMLRVGKWFDVKEGETYQMNVVIGEVPGNSFSQFLLIQEKGVEYEKRPDGQGLLLPVFQTTPTEFPTYKVGKDGPLTSGKTFSFSTAR